MESGARLRMLQSERASKNGSPVDRHQKRRRREDRKERNEDQNLRSHDRHAYRIERTDESARDSHRRSRRYRLQESPQRLVESVGLDKQDQGPSRRRKHHSQSRSRSPGRERRKHQQARRSCRDHPCERPSSKRDVQISTDRISRHCQKTSCTTNASIAMSHRPFHSAPETASASNDLAIPERPASDPDSDPLDAIIGPMPRKQISKVRLRGRGTFALNSAIDSHFSPIYDPAADIHPHSDSGTDWDQALEALRDRHRWKQQGADRLRSAGFTEEEVAKWEKGGEKREEDLRWRRHGEGREWDRGKVVEVDGVVSLKPEWGL